MSTNYLVIDTESSGLFDFSKPADADGQPRLAHLAMILLHEDLSESSSLEFFIKPDGWTLQPEAAAVNGLTEEILNAKGVPVRVALDAYAKLIDEGFTVIAYNAQFDTKIMRGELRRAGLDDRFTKTPNICAMRACTDVCQVPRAKGKGFKFPKLAEACAFFEIKQDAQHTATDDARVCVEIVRRLSALEKLPAAEVHFAKERPTP